MSFHFFSHFYMYIYFQGREDINQSDDAAQPQQPVPIIYACATMWHETEKEMTQLLKSLFRLVI